MVEAAPQGEAFPTGENDENRKCFGLCEIYGAQHCRDGVNKNPAKSLGKKELAPRHGFEPRFTAPKAAVLPLDDRGMVTKRLLPTSLAYPKPPCNDSATIVPGSHSWPALGAGFKPVVRHLCRRWVRLPLASATLLSHSPTFVYGCLRTVYPFGFGAFSETSS